MTSRWPNRFPAVLTNRMIDMHAAVWNAEIIEGFLDALEDE